MLKPNPFILTRYLYIKDEVEIALTVSLLEKQREASLFWAYELYHGGFQEELMNLLWSIYFDFFASLNPSFEAYFLKKEKEWKQTTNDMLVAIIVENLLIRPFNTDVFMLYNHTTGSNLNLQDQSYQAKWIETADYVSIAQFVLHESEAELPDKIYEHIIDTFEVVYGKDLQKQKLVKNFKTIAKYKPNIVKQILLSKIMCLFSTTNKKTKGKNLYMHVEPSDMIVYETCEDPEVNPYRLLNKVCLFGTNDNKQLQWFPLVSGLGLGLARKSITNLLDVYHDQWLFYASFSPIWLSRIQKYGGFRDNEKKQIVFECEDQAEMFYNKYNYEPDEQGTLLKQKTVPHLDDVNDTQIRFQEKYNTLGIYQCIKN